ncbi:MAG TPA: hypothetical protein VH796_15595 [Nitrososphaeraceae archaeon]|jgi:hypothetical protein
MKNFKAIFRYTYVTALLSYSQDQWFMSQKALCEFEKSRHVKCHRARSTDHILSSYTIFDGSVFSVLAKILIDRYHLTCTLLYPGVKQLVYEGGIVR